MASNPFQLLSSRRLLPLFLTQMFGAFNDNAVKSALTVLITFSLATNVNQAQMLINVAGGIFILPFFLFSATAGQLADKFNRNVIIHIIKFSEIIFMCTALLSFYLQQVSLMMVSLFLMATHSVFFGPIKYSALPDLLQPNEVLAGNGLVEASTFIAILLGTILGTILAVDQHGALLVALIGIGVALAGFISSFFIPRITIAEPTLTINWNFIIETSRLIKQVRQNRLVLNLILVISWFWLIGFTLMTQFPVYTKHILHGDQHIVTLFLVVFSIGIAIGALLCNGLLRGAIHHLKYVSAAMGGVSLFILDICWASHAMQFSSTLPSYDMPMFLKSFSGLRITLDLLLLSVCAGFYVVPLYTMVQAHSVPAMRSRVIAANNIFNAVFMVVAAAMTIILVSMGCSVLHLFALVALINILVSAFVWRKMA